MIRLSPTAVLYPGDCIETMKSLPDNSIDSVVCDPPYHLTSIVKRFGGANAAPAQYGTDGAFARASRGFMQKNWDGGDIAFQPSTWAEVLRVLKPGGYCAAFGAPRNFGRLQVAMFEAGFEERDTILNDLDPTSPIAMFLDSLNDAQRDAFVKCFQQADIAGMLAWKFGTGFPKSKSMRDIGRPELGTQMKPAFEPIVLARKPLSEGTVAANVLRWGTGALNIGACRVEAKGRPHIEKTGERWSGSNMDACGSKSVGTTDLGRWPANVVHDGSDEVVGAFPNTGASKGGSVRRGIGVLKHDGENSRPQHSDEGGETVRPGYEDQGSAARFFFNTMETDDQWLARNLPRNHASPAENCFNLSSELAVSVLRNAADLSMLELVPRKTDSAAPSMSATPSELRLISGTLIETMQSFERKSSLEVLQERLFLSGNPANFVATKEPTGTTMITISLSKSDGSAEHVIYSITPTNSVHGVKDCVPSTTRFHYSAKASKADRAGSKHPTVKPIALMEWLATLITPPGGTILDPFAGSGTTGAAARNKGFNCILIEREDEYVEDIKRRLSAPNVDTMTTEEKLAAIAAEFPDLEFTFRLPSRPDPLARLLRWNAAVASYRAKVAA